MLISNSKPVAIASRLKQISLGIVLLSLASCRTPLISIEDISSNKIGKIVYLTGTVVHLAPLLDNAAYQIEDPTGEIWVVTTQNPPKLGQQIEVKGKIEYQSLPFAERELGDFYLVELEQLPLPVEETPSDNRSLD